MTERAANIRDATQRETILTDLERNFLVEAAAGTGKTTSMVGRMVELVATGRCAVEQMAAVTFTRKAAGELRTRFREQLEKRLEPPDNQETGERAERIAKALEQPGLGFVGTIHSFCARLIRERPVEAGVDPDFREIEQEEDEQLRAECWHEFIAGLIAGSDPALSELDRLGILPSDLERAYSIFCDYPDIDRWPLPPEIEPLTAGELDRVLAPRIERIGRLLRELRLPPDTGNDKLIPLFRKLLRMFSQADRSSPAELAEILTACRPRTVVRKIWPDSQRAVRERDEWEEFCTREAEPLLARWRAMRYTASMELLHRAADYNRHGRLQSGRLNFTDLLLAARDLLENSHEARSYFARRFTHLLVDEFQDTDPVQAEIMLLLTAEDPAETDWTRCRPRPGALFVVGDPKQSIYRFRRADIVTYEQVRDRIRDSGGEVLLLWSNFRTKREVVGWVNDQFADNFGGDLYSPEYVRLEPARDDPEGGRVEQLWLDEAGSESNSSVRAVEPGIVAAAVRDILERAGDGEVPRVMVLTWRRAGLALYSAALDRLGIANQVSGGSSLGLLPQVRQLWLTASAAARPEDPLTLVAALRSEAFGFSDPALYELVRNDGVFRYLDDKLPPGLKPEAAESYRDAFARLKRYARWLEKLAPVAALERIAADMGLFAAAAAARGGNQRAGGLARALEIVRGREQARNSVTGVLELLRRLAEGELEADSTEARPGDERPVAVMNLHKAKGLEADVVFLADPTGFSARRTVEVHVDRSGAESRGFLAISRQNPFGGPGELLASHPDWPDKMDEERKFLEAERVRLLYVAATRARDRLVVSSREKGDHHNPWKDFRSALDDCDRLDYGNLNDPLADAGKGCGDGDLQAHPPELAAAWERVAVPGYELDQAKRLALSGSLSHPGASGEHGTEWGQAVHLLLEAGARKPGQDLSLLASRLLDPENCEGIDIDSAVDTARAVLESDLWRRAAGAQRVMAEVPFELVRWNEQGVPAVVRGMVDLAFREPDGWVLVDYKTDRDAESRLDELTVYYAGQLRFYAAAWESAVGENVKETGLYFTGPGLYKTID
ncbi:MAG: AAA family ATPase [Candidatus Glassbacteria bacterium]|nr:AAA family ATPase [Candidatus Glassbacteria bacterium]